MPTHPNGCSEIERVPCGCARMGKDRRREARQKEVEEFQVSNTRSQPCPCTAIQNCAHDQERRERTVRSSSASANDANWHRCAREGAGRLEAPQPPRAWTDACMAK